MRQYRAKPRNWGRCNDYPEREYTQVSGSAGQPEMVDEIVCSMRRRIAVLRKGGIELTTLFEHQCWFMEELFVAPLHYGFVFFGWLALAIAGVLLQVFASFGNLIGNQVVEAIDTGLISK